MVGNQRKICLKLPNGTVAAVMCQNIGLMFEKSQSLSDRVFVIPVAAKNKKLVPAFH